MCLLAPGYGYMLDRLGYGLVLIFLTTLTIATMALQAIPRLAAQVCGPS